MHLNSFCEASCLPPHLLAQKLNNRGAAYMDVGRYDRAIAVLVKALKLSEQQQQQQMGGDKNDNDSDSESEYGCSCRHCSLENCMSKSSQRPGGCCTLSSSTHHHHQSMKKDTESSSSSSSSSKSSACVNNSSSSSPSSSRGTVCVCHNNSNQNTTTTTTNNQNDYHDVVKMNDDDDDVDHDNTSASILKGGYLYQNPIRVSKESIQGMHNMGVTLSLMIIFNLALAYHLLAITGSGNGGSGETTKQQQQQQQPCKRRLQKALQLYELAYQLQLEEDDAISSLRFTMIIANNLSEIHRVAQNHEKHLLCLQHLLSTMMYMVDCRIIPGATTTTRRSRINNDDDDDDSMDEDEDDNDMDNDSSSYFQEMDGFFRNTSQLILSKRCAGAA